MKRASPQWGCSRVKNYSNSFLDGVDDGLAFSLSRRFHLHRAPEGSEDAKLVAIHLVVASDFPGEDEGNCADRKLGFGGG